MIYLPATGCHLDSRSTDLPACTLNPTMRGRKLSFIFLRNKHLNWHSKAELRPGGTTKTRIYHVYPRLSWSRARILGPWGRPKPFRCIDMVRFHGSRGNLSELTDWAASSLLHILPGRTIAKTNFLDGVANVHQTLGCVGLRLPSASSARPVLPVKRIGRPRVPVGR